ncbi:protein FATTY ACID EXPORT 7-like isoform X1 [Magnolia sinica]|uniref:protein FATTY ACID EXPORT 7-like isoform X1 n=1 Tax=Magnolia sinica TaxID=86752 RepID=UPI0026583A7C|nr:protein FATTY ACID EXPORT 7-like isoform X1 [Magnolia sinica]
MSGMSLSQKLTLGYAALVGVGGVMGYIKSGSQKSLAAGSLSSALLFYVYSELPVRPTFAASLGLGLSVALLGMMGSRFKKTRKFFPAVSSMQFAPCVQFLIERSNSPDELSDCQTQARTTRKARACKIQHGPSQS